MFSAYATYIGLRHLYMNYLNVETLVDMFKWIHQFPESF